MTVTNGMVTPVNGVHDLDLRPAQASRSSASCASTRASTGQRPSGTPIFAAFDGTIAYAGDGKGYGNVVRITHAGGRETRYAHMSRFADKPQGRPWQVKAGEVVGYVGTTGLSTGPHLHFELYQGAQAIDPLQTAVRSPRPIPARATRRWNGWSTASCGWRAAATPRPRIRCRRRPGLGQFISSTWLRMMRTYRPDLARSLSQADLLALRFDPTISREMVRRLAQEGEAYLQARGHQITAGRLYLCHFLGMEGAHLALSSPDSATVAAVMGGGRDERQSVPQRQDDRRPEELGRAQDGAARASRRRRPRPSAPVTTTKNVGQTSPEFVAFKASIARLVLSPVQPPAVRLPPTPPAAAEPDRRGRQGPDRARPRKTPRHQALRTLRTDQPD